MLAEALVALWVIAVTTIVALHSNKEYGLFSQSHFASKDKFNSFIAWLYTFFIWFGWSAFAFYAYYGIVFLK